MSSKTFTEKHKKIFVLLAILIIVLIFWRLNSWISNPKIFFHDKWSFYITIFGGDKAYHEFKKSAEKRTFATQHSEAHQFGRVLYSKYGQNAIDFCDESFGYGCYHALIGDAIIAEGNFVVKNLAERCMLLSNSLHVRSCQHGIGHGLIGYYGYNKFGIRQSIKVCNDLSSILSPNDCGSGIFMEYNFQDMSPDPESWRKIQPENLKYPYDDIDDNFQPICYFQQASWWLKVLPGDSTDKVKWIDQLCSGLSPVNRRECFKGLSFYLGSYFNWDTDAVKKACLTESELTDQIECLEQTAKIFANGHQMIDQGRSLCQAISEPKYMEICLKQISPAS